MQIHDLNTGTPASGHYIAMDTGSDTYKATPGDVVPSYTSGDSSSASSWTSVTAVGTGLSFSTLINRITTMMKNVRYLYTLLGTTSISGIGNGTVTGALSTLNSNMASIDISSSFTPNTTAFSMLTHHAFYDKATGLVTVIFSGNAATTFTASTTILQCASTYIPSNGASGVGLLRLNDGSWTATTPRMYTSGTVVQSDTNTAKGIMGIIIYKL